MVAPRTETGTLEVQVRGVTTRSKRKLVSGSLVWFFAHIFNLQYFFCKIFGPTKERDGTWRFKTNDELDKLIRHKNIINYLKAQRLSWFGHLHRMSEERMVKKVYKWNLMLTKPLGRPKIDGKMT